MKRGKNYIESAKLIEAGKTYEVADALALVLETAKAKFDETIEIHARLGVDPRHADQQVRGVVVLPNGTGRSVRVLAIVKADKIDIAKAAGADAEDVSYYDKKTIDKWLDTFCRRFFSQQFKRSCLPDGPKVGSVAVSPRGDLRMPSDASAALWM